MVIFIDTKVQRKNEPLITYWRGGKMEKKNVPWFSEYTWVSNSVIFVKEAELVLSCFSLCLKVLLKLWSSLTR